MAGRPGLTPGRTAATLAALGAGVLGLHLLGLEGLAHLQDSPSALQAVVEPMFTRVLAPQEPPPPPAAAAATADPAEAPPAEGALRVAQVAASAARTARPAPPKAKPAADPDPAPQPASEPAREETAAAAPADTPPVPPAPEPAPVAAASPASTAASAPAAAPAPVVTPADPWPRDTRVAYRLDGQFRGNSLYGSARVQWQRQGPLYQVQVVIDFGLLGSLTLTSQGEATPQGLVPRTYEEVRRSRRRSVRLTDTEVVLQDGRSLPRPPQVQDAASQFIELGQRFASGRQPLALGGTVPVWLARPGGLDPWTYEVAAQELLRTPHLGEVMAWRLKPRPIATSGGSISVEFWFAPSLQYLPARIRLAMGEEATIDLMVETIEQR